MKSSQWYNSKSQQSVLRDVPRVPTIVRSGPSNDGTLRSRAGVKDFRFHDLRYTFASHLIMAGIDLTTVKELLGHKDITMTLRYAHLAPSHKMNAVKVLEERMETNDKNIHVLHNIFPYG